MRDVRAGLDEPRQLAIREVDRVGQHGPRAEPAGAVVDVDVVERLGEEPGDLGDLAAVLGDVGLPVRAGRAPPAPPTRAAAPPSTRPRTVA